MKLRALTISTAIAGLLIAAGCEDGPPSGTAGPAGKLNVLLITLDTTRADHLACYGHPVVETPHLDRLAREGARFTQCSASAPITLPSHCTILLGTEPYVHGIRVNGVNPLSQPNVTLAELMKDSGYQTGAHTGTFVLAARWGLDQGFDTYTGVAAPDEGDPMPDRGGAIAGLADRGRIFAERRGEAVRRDAVAWLAEHGQEPFFLWAHFFDPHTPYNPPEPYRSAYLSPYVGEIAYTDAQVGHLLDALVESGVAERTLVVVVGDHGEGLGEHGEATHLNFLYDSTMHVPLIMWCPGRIPAGTVIDAQVRTLDIVPTVLDLAGLPPKADAMGTSLTPLLAGKPLDVDLEAYGETLSPFYTMNMARSRSLRADGWKYIHVPEPELYHVAEDPAELRNLAADEPRRVETMRNRLHEILSAAPEPPPTTQPLETLTPEEISRLLSLGYIAPSQAGMEHSIEQELREFTPTGPDPKHHIDEIALLAQGMAASSIGNHPVAEAAFRELYDGGFGTSAIVGWYLEALTAQDKLEAAMAVYAALLEDDDPALPEAMIHNDWGLLLHRRGRDAQAAEHYAKAVELDPEVVYYRTNLGNTVLALDRRDEAREQFEAARQLDATNVEAVSGLANIALAEGDPEQAIELFREAIRKDPASVRLHFSLARLAHGRNDLDLAEKEYSHALALAPRHAPSHLGLAQLHLARNQTGAALAACREALRCDARMAAEVSSAGLALAARTDYARAIRFFEVVVDTVPAYEPAANNLAWLLATVPDASLRDGVRARKLAERLAAATQRRNPGILDTLAAAHAEAGEFEQAVRVAQEVVTLLAETESPGALEAARERLDRYKRGEPYRERSSKSSATRPAAP